MTESIGRASKGTSLNSSSFSLDLERSRRQYGCDGHEGQGEGLCDGGHDEWCDSKVIVFDFAIERVCEKQKELVLVCYWEEVVGLLLLIVGYKVESGHSSAQQSWVLKDCKKGGDWLRVRGRS